MIDTKALKEKILDMAMRGKLVEQDEHDEPTSELLKRIKIEKEELIKQKKIKRDKNETEIVKADDGLYYEKYKDDTVKKIDVPYELPKGWEVTYIKNVAQVISGGTPKTSIPEYYGDEVPWITPAEMGRKQTDIYFREPEKFLTELGLRNSSAKKVPKNAIVYSKRAPIGHINIVPFEYSTNQGCLSIIPIFVCNTFLYFVLKKIKNYIENNASGTTFKEISTSSFNNLLIPIPPLEEQKRIVSKIEELFALIDTIEENQVDLQNLAKQLEQKTLDIAMRGKLVEQDENDEPASILLEKIKAEKQRLFEEGKLKKKDLLDSEIIKTENNIYYENLPKSWVITTLNSVIILLDWQRKPINSKEREKRINNLEVKKLYPYYGATGQVGYIDNYLTDGKNILIGEDGAPFLDKYSKKAFIVKGKYWVNNHAHILKSLINIKYLCDYLNSFNYYGFVNGTTRLKLTQGKLLTIPVTLPPLKEQNRIVLKIQDIKQALEKLEY